MRRLVLALAFVGVTLVACGRTTKPDPAEAGDGAAGHAGTTNRDCASFTLADPSLDAAVRALAKGATPGAPLTSEAVSGVVRLSAEGVSTLEGAECLGSLRDLTLYQAAALDLSPLARLPLEKLRLDTGAIDNLGPLASVTTLEELTLSSLNVSDLTPLAPLFALTTLQVANASATEIEALAGLTALRVLGLVGTPVTDISPLSSLSALQVLNLSGTSVADLTPLSALTNLEHLDFSHTLVSEVSAVPVPSGKSSQACLYAEGVPLSDGAVSEGIPSLCDAGWTVSWSTVDGERGVCNGTCGK
jgi:internalin A